MQATLLQLGGRRPSPINAPSSRERVPIALSFREAGDPFAGFGSPLTLRIGLDASLSYGPLRNILARIHGHTPAIELRFVEGQAADVAEKVSHGTLDLGFVQHPVDRPLVVAEACWSETIVVAVPEGHRLAAHQKIGREALRQETFLAPLDEEQLLRTPNEIAATLGGRPRLIIPTQVHRDTLMHLVGLGFGIALTPSGGLGAYYPGVVYRTISDPEPLLPVHALWRPDALTPEASVLLEYARDEGRKGLVA